jgi:hypothetical protein
VVDSSKALQSEIKAFEGELAESLEAVKKDYQTRLDALSEERKEAL